MSTARRSALFTLALLIGLYSITVSTQQVESCDGKTPPDRAKKLAKTHLDAGHRHSAEGNSAAATSSFRAAITCSSGAGRLCCAGA